MTPEAPEAAPEVEAEAAPPAAEAGPDWGVRVEEWGGPERIQDALQIAEALGTREGVEALVREGLGFLELDPDKAFALARGEELPDPDEVLTRAELEAALAKQNEAIAQQEYARAEAIARSAVDAKLTELSVSEPSEQAIVLQFAQQFVSGDEMDPVKLQRAIEQGKAAYDEFIVSKAEQALAARQAKNETVPQPIKGGGTTAGEAFTPETEIKDLETAKALARKFFASRGQS